MTAKLPTRGDRKHVRGRPFPKGDANPRRQGKSGRKPGVKNKWTRDIKEALLNAFNHPKVGGEQFFVKLATRKDPRAFATLVGKLLPTEVTGKNGGPIELQVQKAQAGLANLSVAELETLNRLLTKAGITGELHTS